MSDRDLGKKIDEWHIDGNNAVLRWNSHKYEFCLEVYGMVFKGENAKSLRSQAEIALKKWEKLSWKPVIVIDTHPSDNLVIHYQRLYKAKSPEGDVFRYWKVDGGNERSFSWSSPETGDILEGEPGDIVHGRETQGKTVAYTPEKWQQVRALVAALAAAMEQAKEKLEEILKKDLEGFLESALKGGLPAISFREVKKD
jgi:hypothetical protein